VERIHLALVWELFVEYAHRSVSPLHCTYKDNVCIFESNAGCDRVRINMQGFSKWCHTNDEMLASLAHSSLKFWRRVRKKKGGGQHSPRRRTKQTDCPTCWRKSDGGGIVRWTVESSGLFQLWCITPSPEAKSFLLSCIDKYVTRESRIAQGLDAIWRCCVK